MVQPGSNRLGILQLVQIQVSLFIGFLNSVFYVFIVFQDGLGMIENGFIGCIVKIREGGAVAAPDAIDDFCKFLIRCHLSGPSFV